MCGIAGFIQKKGQADSRTIINDMLKAIAHRGPDGNGVEVFDCGDYEVVLGHQRLSVIDIEGGKQPMLCESKETAISYNGEVFNFLDLKSQLQSEGHQFMTSSDTEVILKSYKVWAYSTFEKLNGMFAFALWDGEKKELSLVRDRFGIKPLYYASLNDGGIVFSSELHSLLKHPQVERQLCHKAVSSYFFHDYVPAPHSVIKNVSKTRPGEVIKWRDSQTIQFQYADVPIKSPLASDINEHDAKEELQRLLKASVKRQLISDVPLGIFLSGGIDSSVIAYEASQLTSDLHTFSIGFERKDYDESDYAEDLAKTIGANHTKEIITTDHLFKSYERAIDILDEPMADASIIPTMLLSEMTRKNVTVALGGDGGDELFGGYPTYKAHKMALFYSPFAPIIGPIIKLIIKNLPAKYSYQSLEWKLKRFFGRWKSEALCRHYNWMSNVDINFLKEIGLDSGFPLAELYKELGLDHNEKLKLNEFLNLDLKGFLVGSVLAKVDRASMSVSLEARPPFLDNELVEFALKMPFSMKMKGLTSKYLLKKSYEGLIPNKILYRPKKGFGVPMASWLEGPLKESLNDAIESSTILDGENLSKAFFQKAYREHISHQYDHSKTLWAFLILERWAIKNGVNW